LHPVQQRHLYNTESWWVIGCPQCLHALHEQVFDGRNLKRLEKCSIFLCGKRTASQQAAVKLTGGGIKQVGTKDLRNLFCKRAAGGKHIARELVEIYEASPRWSDEEPMRMRILEINGKI
jgi:hypothetical protein